MEKEITYHGYGLLIGLVIVLSFELYLHSEDFLHRYRSVFAVGRASDKIDYVVKMQPSVVFIGNSRVDNGVIPKTISSALGLADNAVFNLGIPGLNARVLAGIVKDLEIKKALFSETPKHILIGLDSTLFRTQDELNYSVFFADRWQMFMNLEYSELLGSMFRLWGYSPNLRQLREPARMQDFVSATLTDIEPWGGSVRNNLGYRAKKEKLTEQQRNSVPANYTPPDLDQVSRDYFLEAIKRLSSHGAKIGVIFPPQYGVPNDFEFGETKGRTYDELLDSLKLKGVEVFTVFGMSDYSSDLFSDLGHLNDDGANRFSTSLAKLISQRWPSLGEVK